MNAEKYRYILGGRALDRSRFSTMRRIYLRCNMKARDLDTALRFTI